MQPRSSSSPARGFMNQIRRRSKRRSQDGWSPSEALEERMLLSATIGELREQEYKYFAEPNHLSNSGEFLTGPKDGDAADIGIEYLRLHADDLGVTVADINTARIDKVYEDQRTGVTHLYLRQQVNGLDVIQSSMNVNVTADGEVMNVGSTFVTDTTAPSADPQLDALEALTSMVDEFGWEFDGEPEILSREGGTSDKTVITPAGVSYQDITAELKYVATADGLDLSWQITVGTLDRLSYYVTAVSATDGDVEHLDDYVEFASYDVFALPLENPADGPQTTETDPHDTTASPFGWHDTNGAAGHEFTDTRGNNVNAQEDKNGDDAGGNRPDGGAGLNFNFAFDPSVDADANEDVSITNLFYWNNIVHDVLYHYGFDEPAGNFQENNYGNGGVEGDPVQADALDGYDNGVRNNATFLTLPDGQVSIMSMFGFDFTSPTRDSDLSAVVIAHEFGHGLTNRLTGGAADAGALQAFQARSMGEGWSDWLGLFFTQKTTDQQNDVFPVGNYLLGNPSNDPNGGIREFPYSYDMTVSPKTLGSFRTNSAPHPNGEILAATLWDLNWVFINGNGPGVPAMGFDPDLYNGSGGNNLAMQLVVDALKLQPTQPRFLDFRDAVLLADENLTGGANKLGIWQTFARRGMGFSAVAGDLQGNFIREAFDLPPNLVFRVDPISATIAEDDGPGATLGRIQRGSSNDVSVPMLVTLTNGDPSEIDIPITVTIPAGQTTAFFSIDAVDDTLLDGTQTVSITASSAGQIPWTTTLDVQDAESLTLAIDADQISENDGANATFGTLTRSNTDTLPPNLLVTIGDSLVEYDRNGQVLSTISIPYGNFSRPPGEVARDVVVRQGDRVSIYNGTESALLTELDQNTLNWSHRSFPDLSTDPGNSGSGGIAAYRNYVFMTDMNTVGGPERGLVRFNTTSGQAQRFGRTVPGERLFATANGAGNNGNDLIEIDPITGDIINTMPSPGIQGVRDGLAFDGTNLWYIASDLGSAADDLYRLDPDTGAVRQKYDIGVTTVMDGIAFLNGHVYLLDSFIDNDIVVFDPVSEQVVRVLDIDGLNTGINISGGLAAATNPDVLYATDTFSDDIYEINPQTGQITNNFAQGIGGGDLGLAVVNDEIFVGANVGGDLEVYDRQTGAFVRSVTVPGSIGFQSLGGDDIQGSVFSPYDYVDVTIGLDDNLYALDEAGEIVTVFDPDTLVIDRFLSLDVPANAIGVDSFGQIFGATSSGRIYQYDANGTVLNQLTTGVSNMIDLDIALSGEIIIGTDDGTVVISNSLLGGHTEFSAGATTAFVAFAAAPGSATGDLPVRIVNDDPSEISAASTVTLPAGSQSVVFPVDAVDDFLFDGTQTATLTPIAPGYTQVSGDSVDVLDVENIFIDIDKNAIFENDGPGAATITLSRGNIDGPFDSPSILTATDDVEMTILDTDTVISTVEIAPQVAVVQDVNVTINLEHGRLGDLDVYLVGPSGRRVELFTDVGDAGKIMSGLILDDEAPTEVTGGSDPFTGNFQPEQPLSIFDGDAVSGTWTLEITDDTNRHFGILKDWTLTISALGFPAFDVTVLTSDASEAVPSSSVVTIPQNQLSVTSTLDAIDDTILDGTQNVIFTATGGGYVAGTDDVDVRDYETIIISVDPGEISEDAGPNAATGTVTRTNTDDLSSPLVVTLDNRDKSEISIPDTVTIPAGSLSVTFPIDAVDDNKLDGRKKVRIFASAAGYTETPESQTHIFVTDAEPILEVELGAEEVFENERFLSATVTRTNAISTANALPVSLSSSIPGDATVPPSIVIPAGQVSVDFTITLIDNDLLDGDRNVTITAEAAGTFPGDDSVLIKDFETLSLTFDPGEFTEADGNNASVATITRNNTDTGAPLTVTLTTSDDTEATVPDTVTIPAGQSSANFFVTAVNDTEFDGLQTVSIGATANGYMGETQDVTVFDHEPATLTGPTGKVLTPRPTITWEEVPGATSFHIRIDNRSTGENGVINNDSLPGGITSYTSELPLANGKYRARLFYNDELERRQPPSPYTKFAIRTPPEFITPEALPKDSPPEFSWKAILGAARYELKVNDLTNNQNRIIHEKELTSTSFTPDEMASGKYEAFVRAINDDGFTGDWAMVTFTVLATPTITAPTDGPSWLTQPTITWTSSEGADHYDLRIHDLTDGVNNFIRDRFVPGTEFTPEVEFQVGHNYRISVRAVTEDGLEGAWSDRITTKIGAKPVLLSPTEGSTTDEFPVFRWTEVLGTKRYDFRVREVGKRQNIIRVRNVQGTAYSHSSPLESGKTYRFWVRSVSQLGQKTRWANPLEFTVASTNAGLMSDPAPADQADIAPAGVIADPAESVLIAAAVHHEPVVVNSWVDDASPAAVAQPAAETAVTVEEAPAELDAVMEQLPTLDADWWLPEDAEAAPSEEPLEGLAGDIADPAAVTAGVALGLALPMTRRRRDDDE